MGRVRDIKKSFWISRKENEALKNKSKDTGRTESDLFREFIKDNRLSDKPTDEFYNTIQDLRKIGKDFSKLMSNENVKELDTEHIQKQLYDMDSLIYEIKKKFLV